jgi:hypothetical protein
MPFPFSFFKKIIKGLFPPNSIADWQMNNNANDYSGNGNNGTLIGIPSFTTGQNGAANGALSLNGSSQYFSGGSVGNFTSGSFTISTWINIPSVVGNEVVLGNGTFSTSGYYLQITGSGTLLFAVNDGGGSGGNFFPTTTTTSLSVNTWYNIVIVTTIGGICNIYINGVQSATTQPTIVSIGSATGGFFIGTYPGSVGADDFEGTVDETALWNYALTSTQVGNIYYLGAR